ncbi:hypothetical protein [Variovorax sp. V15]|uniref:hypothetical protein n=1 Tax=Variovorax sp. V15 TaxID=3065952 RepID=UPI0034E8AA9D
MAYSEVIEASNYLSRKRHIQLVGVTDTCPRCHRHVLPTLRGASVNEAAKTAIAVFQCASLHCQDVFISRYKDTGRTLVGGIEIYEYSSSAPVAPLQASFPASIAEVSPNFVSIFNQAVVAEAHSLDQVVGIALRKALEFLIKDFCISQRPADEEAIKVCALATCIENYVADPMVKQIAKRAVWIGNDETHYVRKWVARDVEDLKVLVKLTVNWIDSTLTSNRYLAEMTSGGAGSGKAP